MNIPQKSGIASCHDGNHEFIVNDPVNSSVTTEFSITSYKLCRKCGSIGFYSARAAPHAPVLKFYYKVGPDGQIVYKESIDRRQASWVKRTGAHKLIITELRDVNTLELALSGTEGNAEEKIIRFKSPYENLLEKLVCLSDQFSFESIGDTEVLKILRDLLSKTSW